MSTGILTTARPDRRLRRARGVEHPGEREGEEGADAGQEPDDAEDQPDDRERSAAQHASAGRNALPRDESHDRGGGPEDHAQTQEGAHDGDDPDDERGDGETVGALRRVTRPRVSAWRVARGRRRHIAPSRWRRHKASTRRRWRDVATAWRRRGRIEPAARWGR